jgi:ribosomal protein S18 acetylase RimI-like enzyme
MQVVWRSLSSDDNAALSAQQAACYTADSYYALPLEWDYVKAIAESTDSLCAAHDENIVAAGWLRERDGLLHLRGLVQPEFRGQGLGTRLLEWAETTARDPKATGIRIQNEALTEQADALYRQRGFDCIFAEEIMTRDLTAVLPKVTFLEGIALQNWSAETAPHFYAAYLDAFSTRPNFSAPPLDEWISDHAEDDDCRPDLSYVAMSDGQSLGYILSAVADNLNVWNERCGYVDQVGVIPTARGQGLGFALTALAMQGMKREGLSHARLHVNVNNPGAIGVYRKLGFATAGRRARYNMDLR